MKESTDVRCDVITQVCLCGAAFVILGCGSDFPLQGAITLDGTPLAKAHVVLSPVDRSGAGPFVADTDSRGCFALGPIRQPRWIAPRGGV